MIACAIEARVKTVALHVRRESATPNMLKYGISTDDEQGGELVLTREDLIRDAVRGPLRDYIARGVNLDADAACQYLLCNPAMRPIITHRAFPRVAIDALTDNGAVGLKIMAEAGARAIVALEFRHTLAA